jgi:trk system potassium uptake protein TrkH
MLEDAAATARSPSPGVRGRGLALHPAAIVLMTVPVLWTSLAWVERSGLPLPLDGPDVIIPAGVASILLVLASLVVAAGRRGAVILLAASWAAWGLVLLEQAPHAPALTFLCGAWAAGASYFVLLGGARRPGVGPPRAELGALLSPAVLTSGALGLVIAGLAAGHNVFLAPVGHWAVLSLLGLPAVLASAAEWALVRAGRLEVWKALILSGATALGIVLNDWRALCYALLTTRVLVALAGAARAHALHTEFLSFLWKRPAVLVVSTFALLALAGGIVLKFPACTVTPIAAVDALFTSVSACCVTGLVVLDTPMVFTFAGQAVILVLIQVGGLGIMTLSAFATLLVGGALPSQEEQGLADVVGTTTPRATVRLVRSIVLSTLVIEGVGALLLLPAFIIEGRAPVAAIWSAVFHAVSAFCNAGFALQTDNFIAFQGNPWILHVIGALIILGGLGFGVIHGVVQMAARRGPRLSLQVKLVLLTTAVLLAGGAFLFLLLEWQGLLQGLSLADRLHNAWFQSITTRTAGFNSLDFARLGPAAVLFTILLMFIGASPASTGGGIKTSTAAVLFLAVRAVLKQSPDVQAFGRRMPASAVFRAAAVTAASSSFIACGAGILLATQEIPFHAIIFECVSAFGTVGLSLGVTAALDPLGKLTIAALMLVGRTGPLTLMLLFHGGSVSRVRYPREEVLIG